MSIGSVEASAGGPHLPGRVQGGQRNIANLKLAHTVAATQSDILAGRPRRHWHHGRHWHGGGGVARRRAPGGHDSDGDSHGPVPGLVRVTVAVTVEADTQAVIMSQSRLTSCRAAVGPGAAARERTFALERTHENHAPGLTELDNSHYESSLSFRPAPPGPKAHDGAASPRHDHGGA